VKGRLLVLTRFAKKEDSVRTVGEESEKRIDLEGGAKRGRRTRLGGKERTDFGRQGAAAAVRPHRLVASEEKPNPTEGRGHRRKKGKLKGHQSGVRGFKSRRKERERGR